MASCDSDQPKEVLPKQESPVKDAVRSLEAQLASETSSVPPAPREETSNSDTTTPQTSTTMVPLETVPIPMSLASAEDRTTGVEQQQQVEHVVVQLHQEQPMNTNVEHQQVVINQGQPMVTNMEGQQVVIHQEQPMEHQQVVIFQEHQQMATIQQPQHVQQVVIHQEQSGVHTNVGHQQMAIDIQQPQQVLIHQEQPMAIGEQMLRAIAEAGVPQQQQHSQEQPELHMNVQPPVQQEVPSSGESTQVEGSGSEKENPMFKCVAVSSDGNPDWSKVMSLNKDILREVLEKHGISMDTSNWPEQKDDEMRKKRKLAKKAKKEKKKKKNKKSKDDDGSTYCDICCRNFENPGSLKHHQHMHDEDTDGPRKCTICSLVFQRKIGLRAHMRKSHPNEYSKEEETKDDGDFICEEDECERTFTTKMGLSQHINQHHKGLGKKKNLVKRSPEDLTCHHCSKEFTLPHKLTQHMVMHSEERPYKCKQCDGTFKHHSSLRTHELIHSNKDACSCPVCGTMFKRAQYVRRHMIRVHDLLGVNYIPPAPVKRYPCEMCHRAYERRSELSDHMNSHTGAKPHLCEICAKGFAHKRALDVHRKTHTGKGAFHCDVCAKVFGSKSRMREHRVIHTGEKPFICQQCGTRFAHRANLREHLKSVHKSGMEPLQRGRKKQKRGAMATEAEQEPQQQQQTLQYEVLTTRPHPQIEAQAHHTQVIPVGIHQQGQQIGQEQPQQIMYQEIQLQPVVVPGNANMRSMQVQQVQGGQQVIEARQDDLASVAQIVLQLHTEGTYTVQ